MPADSDTPAASGAGAPAKPRVPEPMVMEDAAAAVAFHHAGRETGPLAPLYAISAHAISRLLVEGGSVLDLGSGSGRFLAYLARRRPDAAITGVELSEAMLTLGRQLLEEEGLADRVRLVRGDMTASSEVARARVDAVSSLLALHQLPSEDALRAALREIAAIRAASGCAVWIADIVRGEDAQAMDAWMAMSEGPDPAFERDALASEAAGWTADELRGALEASGLGDAHHARSPLLQVHWLAARDGRRGADEHFHEAPQAPAVRRRTMAIRLRLNDLP